MEKRVREGNHGQRDIHEHSHEMLKAKTNKIFKSIYPGDSHAHIKLNGIILSYFTLNALNISVVHSDCLLPMNTIDVSFYINFIMYTRFY